jgi:hypothetical protein
LIVVTSDWLAGKNETNLLVKYPGILSRQCVDRVRDI